MKRRSAGLAAALILIVACGSSPVASTPSPSPTPKVPVARGYAWLVDAAGDAGVLLFGGFTGIPPNGEWASDLWSFAPGRGWTRVAASSAVPPGDGFGYHRASSTPLFLDGNGSTWTFDARSGKWAKRSTPNGGPDLHGIHLVYDSNDDRLLTFGGDKFGAAYYQDTWSLDASTWSWTQRVPKTSPPGRSFYAIAYDPKTDLVVLFGGSNGSVMSDTWTYSYRTNTWAEVKSMSSPPARDYAVMVYDPVKDRLLMFGGADDGEAPLDDLWALDLNHRSWSRLNPQGARPGKHAWHAMAFDAEAGVMVLFGGGPFRTYVNETWTFDPGSDTWAQAAY